MDPGPNPAIFVIDLQDANKKLIFWKIFFAYCFLKGTPTKRQVSKRQVSKHSVSKRPKRQVYKTSGLQNVRFTKRQGFKTSGCKMSGFKTSLLVNISKRPFSKKNIDLT
jgi:hypothetical protein